MRGAAQLGSPAIARTATKMTNHSGSSFMKPAVILTPARRVPWERPVRAARCCKKDPHDGPGRRHAKRDGGSAMRPADSSNGRCKRSVRD